MPWADPRAPGVHDGRHRARSCKIAKVQAGMTMPFMAAPARLPMGHATTLTLVSVDAKPAAPTHARSPGEPRPDMFANTLVNVDVRGHLPAPFRPPRVRRQAGSDRP